MDVPFLLAEKVVVSAGIGLMIGLERDWAHKDIGTRSFSFAALLGTLAWLVSPTLAFIEVGVVLVLIVLVNVYVLHKDLPLQVTTSFALAAANVLGILVGSGLLSGFYFRNCADRPPFVEDRACHVYQ